MLGIIYKTTNLVNGKVYIGQHLCQDDTFDGYLGSGTKLKSAIKHYGRRNFKRETLRVCDNQRQLDAWELIYIKKFHAVEHGRGYNILPGTSNEFGSGSPMKIPEVAKKVSKSLKKTYRDHPEIAKRIHQRRQIKLKTTDYKERISKTLRGRYAGDKNPNYGNKWTESQKAHQRAKMIGRYDGDKNPNYGKRWDSSKRKKMSERLRAAYEAGTVVNPMSGKKRITNGIVNKVLPIGDPLPEGFWYGMKPRKR